jgi:prepilin-type N-terminal cleavage/methylation domain-containing protein/prepilin-type processing-associated H-X9-DG protein
MRFKYSKTLSACRFLPAFTLIELLVVMAVISLLLAILLPALHQVRVITKRIICQSNLRQITVAWHLCLDDNNQRFYQGINVNHDFGGWKGNGLYALSRPLNPYLRLPLEIETENEAKIFRCPADSGGIFSRPPQELAYHYFGNSYQTNNLLIGPDQIGVPSGERRGFYREINKLLKNLKRDDVSDPCRLLLVGDNNWITQWDPSYPSGRDWHGRNNRYNLGFLDGHVEFIRIYKDVFVAQKYRVLPFAELDQLAPSSSD